MLIFQEDEDEDDDDDVRSDDNNRPEIKKCDNENNKSYSDQSSTIYLKRPSDSFRTHSEFRYLFRQLLRFLFI